MSAIARRLWAKGLSASTIGEILGAPRNAVLGKAFRMDLKRKEPRQNDEGVPKPRRFNGRKRPVSRKWRVDETYMMRKGQANDARSSQLSLAEQFNILAA